MALGRVVGFAGNWRWGFLSDGGVVGQRQGLGWPLVGVMGAWEARFFFFNLCFLFLGMGLYWFTKREGGQVSRT